MSVGDYPTPAQCGVYIGEWHIDDAYSIDYQWQPVRQPLFSYFKKKFVNVAMGQELVVGSLAINYRYPGYLFHAIRATRGRISSTDLATASQKAREGSTYLESYLDQMRVGTAEDRLRLLLEASAKGPAFLRKVSALAWAVNQRPNPAPSGRQIYGDAMDAQEGGGGRILPVDIWIHYGDLDEPHTAKLLHDVVFVGKSEQLQAGASASGGLSASGINALEVYSFFAKEVESFTMGAQLVK